MAQQGRREAHEPETELMFPDQAEDMEDDASASEAGTLEQEEVAEEGEEEDWDEEASEDEEEGAAEEEPVPEWHYLTDAQRNERKGRVRAWLEQSSRENAQQIVDDLLALWVDTLIRYAFQRFYPPRQADHQTEVTAASSTVVFRDQLLALVHQNQDATRESLIGTMQWGLKNRRGRGEGDLDFMLERCADQVAAMLLFKNLHRATDANETWWEVLLRRTVERIIVPRSRKMCENPDQVRDNRLRPVIRANQERVLRALSSNGGVDDCIEAIIQRAGEFTYQELKGAIE